MRTTSCFCADQLPQARKRQAAPVARLCAYPLLEAYRFHALGLRCRSFHSVPSKELTNLVRRNVIKAGDIIVFHRRFPALDIVIEKDALVCPSFTPISPISSVHLYPCRSSTSTPKRTPSRSSAPAAPHATSPPRSSSARQTSARPRRPARASARSPRRRRTRSRRR